MRSLLVPSLLVTFVALPSAVVAQARGQGWRDTVPLQMLPPAGKCRIWMEGVPAAQQPAPTDCATALRQRPSNGIVLYGPAPRDGGTERFDPKAASTTKPELERGGSAAEQELRRLREVEERRRRMQELRERDERARRETEERAQLGARGRTTGGSTSGTTAPRTGTGTATPRGATTGSSTGSAGSTGSSTSAEPASKAPPEGKRKPE